MLVLILGYLIPILFSLLVGAAALLAWRSWQRRPWLAALAAAVVIAASPSILRRPWLVALAMAAAALGLWLDRRRRGVAGERADAKEGG